MSDERHAAALEEVDVSIGDVVAGKYRIERVIGVGGMGVVLEATHVVLDERVALKFLASRALRRNDKAVRRFLHEAKAAVRIKSEHVARVTDVGTLDNGAPYIVMELLVGEDLDRLVGARGAMRVREAVDVVLQAAEAVAQAHAAGIIHRDLKPANLFLTRRPDGSPCVKVLDFGISKLRSEGFGSLASITGTHTVMGSPAYMAPEQWVSARDADARSDIWSLGAILYELLSGRPPFAGEAMPQLCNQVMNTEPPSLERLRPGVSAELGAAVRRCLQKDAEERYQNVAELAGALAPFGSRLGRVAAERCLLVLETAGLAERPATAEEAASPATSAAARDPLSETTGVSGTPAELAAPPSCDEAGESFVSEPPPSTRRRARRGRAIGRAAPVGGCGRGSNRGAGW